LAKKNRYSSILQPRQVGVGLPEVAVLLLYDVEENKLRNKIIEQCMNYGLVRIQYSAFMGKINRNHRQELCLKIQELVADQIARVHVFPIQEDAVRDIWVLDQMTKRDDNERLHEGTSQTSATESAEITEMQPKLVSQPKLPGLKVIKLEDR
jgi:CRISPR-associated protein Cas2